MSMDFSSWPRDQEQTFVVYEQHSQESSSKALMGGLIAGIAFLVLMVGIFVGVEPEHKDMTKGMNMENLTKKSRKAEAPAPTPAPAPAATEAPKAADPAAPAAPAAPTPAPAAAPDKK